MAVAHRQVSFPMRACRVHLAGPQSAFPWATSCSSGWRIWHGERRARQPPRAPRAIEKSSIPPDPRKRLDFLWVTDFRCSANYSGRRKDVCRLFQGTGITPSLHRAAIWKMVSAIQGPPTPWCWAAWAADPYPLMQRCLTASAFPESYESQFHSATPSSPSAWIAAIMLMSVRRPSLPQDTEATLPRPTRRTWCPGKQLRELGLPS